MAALQIKTIKKQLLTVAGGGMDCLNYLLWPPSCCVCGKSIAESDGIMCRDCRQKFASSTADNYCPCCGKSTGEYAIIAGRCADCEAIDLVFDSLVRIGRYTDVLRDLILKIKHSEEPKICEMLGKELFLAIKSRLPIEQIDIFTAVPLHWRRRLYRGYNQSALLLNAAKKQGHCASKLLIRNRYTLPQPGLTYRQRLRNIKGAFICRKPSKIEGKNICIIDDIKTTGATLAECSRVLKAAGANKVYAAVVAVAKN